MKRQRSK